MIEWAKLDPEQRDCCLHELVMSHHPAINEAIPAYSTSFDAALTLLGKIKEYKQEEAFMEALDVEYVTDDWDTYGMTFIGLKELTPEKICLAALKATGVEIVV